MDEATRTKLQRGLTIAIAATALVTAAAWWRKGTFVSHTKIDPALLEQPKQTETTRPASSFEYKGETYDVRPMFEYEIAGLVVAHNDPGGFGDVYHDDRSVDTKDLGMIWGSNLRSDDFHRVEFWSVSWTINYRWPGGVSFSESEVSNTHLITPDPKVRKQIAGVRVGDQVRLRGILCAYSARSDPNKFWRTSSTTRADTGNGACEVLCVDELQVLHRGTPLAYGLYSLGKLLLALLVVAKAATMLWEASRAQAARDAARPPMFGGPRPGSVPAP